MEKLPETIKLTEWKPEKRLPEYIDKLPKIIKGIVIAIEKSYFEITIRLNRMLKIIVDKDGNVSLGTSDPSLGGNVNSKFTIVTDLGTGLAIGYRDGTPSFAVNPLADYSWIMYDYYGDGVTPTWNAGISQKGGSVGIGTVSPTTDAKLDVDGTDGAFMPPRLTTTQRDALTPSEGMMIYNATTKRFEGYEDDAWVDL